MNGLPMKASQGQSESPQSRGTQDLAEKETTGLFTQFLIPASTLKVNLS